MALLRPARYARRPPSGRGASLAAWCVWLLTLTCAAASTARADRPRLVVVRVTDGAGSRHGNDLRKRLEKVLLDVDSVDRVPLLAFGGAARRNGIAPRDWLTRDALPVILDEVGADYVVVGRLLRPSTWDYELELLVVDRRMRRVARTSLRAGMELSGGREYPAFDDGDLRASLESLVASLPPVKRRPKPKTAKDPPAAPRDEPVEEPARPPEHDAPDAALGDGGGAATEPSSTDSTAGEAGGEEGAGGAEGAEGAGMENPDDLFLGEDSGEITSFDPMAALAAAEAAYSVGGRMLLNVVYTLPEQTLPWLAPWQAPSFVELYADARPSERVRAFVQGRVDYDFTLDPTARDLIGNPLAPVDLRLDQLWVAFDLFHVAFFTVGRQRIRWGAGRIWNPTDFLNQERRDALDVVDRRLGVDLLKVDLPIAALGMSNYVIASVRDAFAPATAGLALRSELAFSSTELSLSAAFRLDEPVRLGFDFSSGLWVFDVRAELAAQYGSQKTYYRGRYDPFRGLKPAPYQRDNELLLSGVVGISADVPYWIQRDVTIGVEYFYNGGGYRDTNLYPWLIAHNAFEPLYVGEHYAGAYLSMPSPFGLDDLSLTFNTIGNLSDLSFLSRLDVRYTFLTFLQLGLHTTYHYGAIGELHLGLDAPPDPDVRALKEGLRFPPSLLDVGLSLFVNF